MCVFVCLYTYLYNAQKSLARLTEVELVGKQRARAGQTRQDNMGVVKGNRRLIIVMSDIS